MNTNPTPLLRLLPLICALSLSACSDPRSDSLARLHRSEVAELRAEVARLYTRLFPAPGLTFIPVRAELWPVALVKLHPLRMNLYRDGIAVSLQASPGFEYGLHIEPTGATDALKSTERTQYEKLQDGIYYFTQRR